MDREHVKGASDKLKGSVKDAVGKISGDEKLQTIHLVNPMQE